MVNRQVLALFAAVLTLEAVPVEHRPAGQSAADYRASYHVKQSDYRRDRDFLGNSGQIAPAVDQQFGLTVTY
jgi:hypothetical protein